MAKVARVHEPVLIGPEIQRKEDVILPDGTRLTIPLIGDTSLCGSCFFVLAETSDRFILQEIPHKSRIIAGIFTDTDADIISILKMSREIYLCPEDVLELLTGYTYADIDDLPAKLKEVRNLISEESQNGLENDETD